jgi:D-alanyl-D-alanine carboxypeptidase
VLATWENGARVITVLLGSGDRYGDANTLLGYLNQQFQWVRLGRNGDLAALNQELAQKGLSLGIVRTVLLTAPQAADLKYMLESRPVSGVGPFRAQGDVVFLIGAQPILRLSIYTGDPFNSGG